MMTRHAFLGAAIFDGAQMHHGKALVLQGQTLSAIVPSKALSADTQLHQLDGGTILPGFVDLQVNGGGGVMLNDAPTVEGVRTIAEAHATTGTRALLPTLITDTPAMTAAAIEAVESAIAQKVPGILGLHLEGPHLSVARKGAHDPALIRPMTQNDLDVLCKAAQRLPNLLVTVAPENVSPCQITALANAGARVSLGHTDCTFDQATEAFAAGATCVTHLFNAMSALSSREPGLVGAAFGTPGLHAGLIADAVHVHPHTMKVALTAKAEPRGVFLVTDAMATGGSEITEFTLNDRRVLRRNGRLTLEDGTLAGADLAFPRAIEVLTQKVGIPFERALAMATSWPASLLRRPMGAGHLTPGEVWTGIYLDAKGQYQGALLPTA